MFIPDFLCSAKSSPDGFTVKSYSLHHRSVCVYDEKLAENSAHETIPLFQLFTPFITPLATENWERSPNLPFF